MMTFTLLRRETHKCRKLSLKHRCVECGNEILTGDVYEVETALYDGLQTCHRHVECVTLRKALERYNAVSDYWDDPELWFAELRERYDEIKETLEHSEQAALVHQLWYCVKGRAGDGSP